MDPEDRELLIRAVKLGEENRQMLRYVKRSIFWDRVWSAIKIIIIAVPLVVGYFFLQPYFGSGGTNGSSTMQSAKDLLKSF